MNLGTFVGVLSQNPDAGLHLKLPDGSLVPAHFHVTEVGRVQKDFIDCGGTTRSTAACLLQVWVADDTHHRIDTTKLARIIRAGAPLFPSMDLPVEVEYESGVVSQYPVGEAEATPSGLLLHLGRKHTACLAQDRCGVAPLKLSLASPAPAAAGAEACCAPGCC